MVKIPNHIIEQVINGNDIVQIVSEHVKLDKQGRNYFGLCPFHSEKTPSFSVSPEKQIFHCFSCGEGGNVAQFISKIDNLSFIDSIKKLASRINLHIDNYFDDNKSVEESKYFSINQFVLDYYQFALLNTKEGKEALQYLYKRNITDDLIKQFKIGLAPDSVNSLYLALKLNQYTELSMIELGHVTKANDQFYDKFKNRIMFPIFNEYGDIVGFSGRSYLDKNKNEAKYINTQETPIFKKGEIIYHLNQAKKTIKQNKRVFLFEGFMDVIASVKSGILESVATMGTALTEEHVLMLKKLTRNVIICYDGDHAGIEATKRAIELLNRHQLAINVVTLPEGLDPDDYVNKFGKDKYNDYINLNQKSYKEYLYSLTYSMVNFNNISTIDEFKKKIFQLISTSTPTERELFLQKLSNDIHVSMSTLQFDYNQYTQYIHKIDEPSNNDIIMQERIIKGVKRSDPSSKKLLETQKIMIFYCLYNRKFVNIINTDQRIAFKDSELRRLFYELNDYYNKYDSFNQEDFLKKNVTDDDFYQIFFPKIYSEYKKFKGPYNDLHLKQCFAVIVNHLIAVTVDQLKFKMSNSTDQVEKAGIAQQILEQQKLSNEENYPVKN